LFSEAGVLLGESPLGEKQSLFVHFLPGGRYFVRIEGMENSDNSNTYLYLLKLQKVPGQCKSDSDCSYFYESERLRSQCNPTGSCNFLGASADVPQGGLCDRTSDCVPGLYCLAEQQLYTADMGTRSICTKPCLKNSDCPESMVCGDTLPADQHYQFCMPPCSSDLQCTAIPWKESENQMTSWIRMKCKENRCSGDP
jgi:hypothetical protein